MNAEIVQQAQKKAEKRGRGGTFVSSVRLYLGNPTHYRVVLHQFGSKLGPRLLVAQSAKDIVSAVREDAARKICPFTSQLHVDAGHC
jgi:hypothetical protein